MRRLIGLLDSDRGRRITGAFVAAGALLGCLSGTLIIGVENLNRGADFFESAWWGGPTFFLTLLAVLVPAAMVLAIAFDAVFRALHGRGSRRASWRASFCMLGVYSAVFLPFVAHSINTVGFGFLLEPKGLAIAVLPFLAACIGIWPLVGRVAYGMPPARAYTAGLLMTLLGLAGIYQMRAPAENLNREFAKIVQEWLDSSNQ